MPQTGSSMTTVLQKFVTRPVVGCAAHAGFDLNDPSGLSREEVYAHHLLLSYHPYRNWTTSASQNVYVQNGAERWSERCAGSVALRNCENWVQRASTSQHSEMGTHYQIARHGRYQAVYPSDQCGDGVSSYL